MVRGLVAGPVRPRACLVRELSGRLVRRQPRTGDRRPGGFDPATASGASEIVATAIGATVSGAKASAAVACRGMATTKN